MRRIADSFAQAFKGMFRNGLVTFISIFVLISCLIFVGSFALISANLDYNLKGITELNEIDVFLNAEMKDDAVAAQVNATIAAMPGVKSTTLYSRQDGLEQMKDEFNDYRDLFNRISDEENPLPYKIVFIYEDGANVADLVFNIEAMEHVNFTNARLDIAASMESLKNGISIVFVWFALLCLVVCMFVIINTIKLSVYSRREEITIMRYIGASRAYISAPFVLEGIFIGIIGAASAFFIEKLIYSGLMGFVAERMDFVKLYSFAELTPALLIVFFGLSLLCGIVGSLVSLGKYIEV